MVDSLDKMCYNKDILGKENKMTKEQLFKMAEELNVMTRLLSDAIYEGVSDELELSLDEAIFELENAKEIIVNTAKNLLIDEMRKADAAIE